MGQRRLRPFVTPEKAVGRDRFEACDETPFKGTRAPRRRPCSQASGKPERHVDGALRQKLREFSILAPHYGVTAAFSSWEDLPQQLRNALAFLCSLPSLPRTQNFRPLLPPSTKPTLVLDLDETLVHCCRGATQTTSPTSPDVIVEFDDGISIGQVHFRPFVQIFLEVVAKTFDVVVFTASQQSYADQVIDILDPRKLISHRLYREHCTEFCGAYFKELGLLGRALHKCILVDNNPISVACNVQNGVLIRSWYGDLKDQELLALLEVLEDMQRCTAPQEAFTRYLSVRYGLLGFFQALSTSYRLDTMY